MPQQPSPRYFTEERAGFLPDFKINKVIVERPGIRLMCSLRRDFNKTDDSWLGSSDFMKYINFYFIVASRMGEGRLGHFYYPETRVQSLQRDGRILTWEDSIFENRDAPRYPVYGAIKVSMIEVIEGKFFQSNQHPLHPRPTPALSPAELFGSQVGVLAPGHDTKFEVFIDCRYGWANNAISSTVERNAADTGDFFYRDLISFCHLDIRTLSEDYNLERFVGNLQLYGGPMKFQNLLEGAIQPGGYIRWTVPQKTYIFFDELGSPYSGLVHEHTPELPGPDGYIGFMSGPGIHLASDPMNQRKKLTRREVPNNTVSSKLFMEGALDLNGNPLTYERNPSGDQVISGPDPRYVGFRVANQIPNPVIITQQNMTPSPHGILTMGDDLINTLKSEMGISSLGPGSPLAEQKKKFFAITGEKNKKPGFCSGYSQEFKNSNWLSIGASTTESYYGTIFIVDMPKVAKFNSKFGYMIDFHSQEVEDFDFQELNDTDADYSPRVLSFRMANESMQPSFRNLKITRKRITNTPDSNNRAGTPSYSDYDENQIQEIIYSTAISADGAENIFPEKSEIEMTSLIPGVRMKDTLSYAVIIKDYDLYRNVTHGKYRYTIEALFEDTACSYLKSLYKKFSELILDLREYLNLATRPYVYNPETAQHNSGSYDYEQSSFSGYFRNERPNAISVRTVNDITYHYILVSYLLTKKTTLLSRAAHRELSDSLSPVKGDVSNIRFFLSKCLELQSLFRKTIYSDESLPEENINYKTNKPSPQGTETFLKDTYSVKSEVKNTVTVVSKNSVFFEPAESGFFRPEEVLAGSVNYFTLTERESRQIQPVGIIAPRNSAGDTMQPRAHGQVRNDIVPIGSNQSTNRLYASIAAAIENSETAEPFDRNTSSGFSEPLQSFNGLLSAYGGTTFSHLLSLAINKERGDNTCGVADADAPATTEDVEAAIFQGIENANELNDFMRNIDNNYRELLFKEESLGALFDFTSGMMARERLNIEILDVNNNGAEAEARGTTNYMNPEDRVNAGMNSSRNIAELGAMQMYTMDNSGGWTGPLEAESSIADTGIHMFMPVARPGIGNIEAVPVNNVFVRGARPLSAFVTLPSISETSANVTSLGGYSGAAAAGMTGIGMISPAGGGSTSGGGSPSGGTGGSSGGY